MSVQNDVFGKIEYRILQDDITNKYLLYEMEITFNKHINAIKRHRPEEHKRQVVIHITSMHT